MKSNLYYILLLAYVHLLVFGDCTCAFIGDFMCMYCNLQLSISLELIIIELSFKDCQNQLSLNITFSATIAFSQCMFNRYNTVSLLEESNRSTPSFLYRLKC